MLKTKSCFSSQGFEFPRGTKNPEPSAAGEEANCRPQFPSARTPRGAVSRRVVDAELARGWFCSSHQALWAQSLR